MKIFSCALLLSSLFFACSGTRKISQVGLREPASDGSLVSQRDRWQASLNWSGCPTELKENLLPLVQERIVQGDCAASLSVSIRSVYDKLTSEERVLLEELISSRCRSLGGESFAAENLLQSYNSTGPGAKFPNDPDIGLLKDGLNHFVRHSLPLNRWVQAHGPFVLNSESLDLLFELVTKHSCRADGLSLDELFRMVRSTEELVSHLQDPAQRKRLESLLEVLRRLLDQQVSRFF